MSKVSQEHEGVFTVQGMARGRKERAAPIVC